METKQEIKKIEINKYTCALCVYRHLEKSANGEKDDCTDCMHNVRNHPPIPIHVPKT